MGPSKQSTVSYFARISGVLCAIVLIICDVAGASDLDLHELATREFPKALLKLKKEADRALSQPPVSVIDKTVVAPSGDIHDFLTLSPYHWPNPNLDNGQPYVWRDGQVNPDANSNKYDRVRYFALGKAVTTLALAYRITLDERYSEHAARLMRAYFVNKTTAMNPNLEYCQFVPGKVGGNHAGIIRGTQIVELIEAAHWLEGSSWWTTTDREAWTNWLRGYLRWLLDSKLGKAESRSFNNHGTWYDVQVVTLALECKQTETVNQVLKSVGNRRIGLQIAADGRQPFELMRTKSWDYSLFNLEAYFQIARLAETQQIDLWNWHSEKSGGIHAALDYLVPFGTGKRDWQGKQIKEFDTAGLYPLLIMAEKVYRDPHCGQFAASLRDFEPATSIESLRLLTRLKIVQ